MSLATVRTEVVSILGDVSGIGQVLDYERYAKDWASYRSIFKEGAHINFTQILRPSFSRIVHGSSAVERVTHNFILKGAYSLRDADASEKVCQNLVEAICQAFRNIPKLNDEAEVVNYPITGRIFNGMFGNVLCHIYEIEVSIRERIVFG